MFKQLTVAFLAIGMLLIGAPVGAQPPTLVPATVTPSGRTVIIPDTAVQVADHVFDLGTAIDPATGKKVQGLAIIHPKSDFAKPPGVGEGKKGGAKQCFAYLSRGAKWKAVESWVVNAANTRGLTQSFVFNNLTGDIAKWEDAADGSVNGLQGADILGDGATTNDVLVADTSSPDGANEVYFADVSSQGAIAVTIVWGVFFGPPSGREIVEWDMVFDDVDFDWSADGEAGKMDFENIATHELGHAVGLDHPDDSCTEETMYRFADFGETKKQTLNAGDIAGIDGLY